MITGHGCSRMICRNAPRPSSTGISTSNVITSGRSAFAFSTASTPFAANPQSWMRGLGLSIRVRALRTITLSSAISTRMTGNPPSRSDFVGASGIDPSAAAHTWAAVAEIGSKQRILSSERAVLCLESAWRLFPQAGEPGCKLGGVPPEPLTGNDATIVRFALFEADLRARELRRQGRRLRLQEQPFAVLAVLLERPGALVTREELRQRLWPADTFVDFDHSLNTAVNKLRDVLGDSATDPRLIQTLSRRGYRFVAAVEKQKPTPNEGPGTPVGSAGPAAPGASEDDLPGPHPYVTRVLLAALHA